MNNLTNEQLGDRVKKMRIAIKGIINHDTEILLLEIERRLKGSNANLFELTNANSNNMPVKYRKKKVSPKKPTKAELRAKFSMKGLH